MAFDYLYSTNTLKSAGKIAFVLLSSILNISINHSAHVDISFNAAVSCDFDDCITVIGDNDWIGTGTGGGFVFDGGSSAGSGSVGSGNGGGSSGSNSSDPTKNKNACNSAVEMEHNMCITMARGTAIATTGLCAGFVIPQYIAACSVAAGLGSVIAEYDCNTQLIASRSHCNTLP